MRFLGTLSCDQIAIFAQTLFLLTMLAEASYYLDPIFKAENTWEV